MPKVKTPARLENLENLQKFIASFARSNGFSEKRVLEIELTCEEAMVNIFSYAYLQGEDGDVEIDCNVDSKGDLIIGLVDSGRPFDPNEVPEPDINKEIPERQIGGLGSLLIKKFADERIYRRLQNKNFLTFKFHKTD